LFPKGIHCDTANYANPFHVSADGAWARGMVAELRGDDRPFEDFYGEAVCWYTIAAAQGHADGLESLAAFCNDHDLLTPEQTFNLFEASAKKGNYYALRNLAGYYRNGFGTPRDLQKSAQALAKAHEVATPEMLAEERKQAEEDKAQRDMQAMQAIVGAVQSAFGSGGGGSAPEGKALRERWDRDAERAYQRIKGIQ
jgi:TPR repeat protein